VLAKDNLNTEVKYYVFSNTNLIYMKVDRINPITEGELVDSVAEYPK